MVVDVDYVVRSCTSSAQNNPKCRQKRNMQLFSASGALEFTALEIVKPFPKVVQGRQHIFVIADCYSKLTRAILILRMTATHIANVFKDHLLISYDILTYLLIDIGNPFVSIFFATVCAIRSQALTVASAALCDFSRRSSSVSFTCAADKSLTRQC